MRAFEIWPKLSKELNHEILETACLHEKRLYRHTVQDLSEAMRKRMPAVLELPRATRHELFQPLLGWSKFDVLGHNLVINWLRVAGEPMMVAFLDAVEVRHDGRGCTENFPATVAAAKLATACQLLYEKFPAEKVTLYLQLFPNISGVRWGLEQHLKV
ncbi:MAG: hypothetical protein LBK71_08140 [Verrucomicrobiales bacterium]|jgi:hypothetical protein|nr:hypothetical protein [Verrucomicrobiales bacterium]